MFIFIAFVYIYTYIFMIFHDCCFVLELSFFQVFSYIIYIVELSITYVEQISF